MIGAPAALPHAVCLVPEKRTEITTEGGLDVAGQLEAPRGPVGGLSFSVARMKRIMQAARA